MTAFISKSNQCIKFYEVLHHTMLHIGNMLHVHTVMYTTEVIVPFRVVSYKFVNSDSKHVFNIQSCQQRLSNLDGIICRQCPLPATQVIYYIIYGCNMDAKPSFLYLEVCLCQV